MADDVKLVERALAGSEEAYRLLLRRYQRPILGLLCRMVRDPALAEDLAQEVFVKAFRALDSFDRSRKFSSWLFKIAHNTAIDQLRRRELDTLPLETPDPDSADLLALLPDDRAEDPVAAAERRQLATAIEHGIEQLRPSYREVLLLRFEQGLAYEEIADVTGLPLGTVKTHLFRARKALARWLAEQGWEPAG